MNIKFDEKGLVPVVVQEHISGEVLMLAYMNEEALDLTIKTKKATYFSRSRNKLWIKGETSGCYQIVKSIDVDCDEDTILLSVEQLGGGACHTGNRTCFYRTIEDGELREKTDEDVKFFELASAMKVDMNVLEDRKANPKEGSYTTYLFNEGVDKILKKVGEEATEIIIAAKNPEVGEMRYEIADFLYHVSVLMVDKGLSWEDVLRETMKRQGKKANTIIKMEQKAKEAQENKN